ncbi:nuclear transport factor 2 family protein [Sphingobium sp. CFD-2]
MNHSVEDVIRELENRRIAALVSTDLAALNNLLADDLVHVHGNGKIDDKEEYLQGVASKYRYHSIQRGDLNIRVFGNVAIVVGRLSQTV